jgi:predicted MPP superfamily phosphohydrolase
MTSILFIADLHCGHKIGITPPDWQSGKEKLVAVQKEMWSEYLKMVSGKWDILVVNGDAIDGDGIKSSGTELITTDRIKQADIAVQAIKKINASKIFMTYGTGYHTGNAEDFEKIIAESVKAETIKSNLFLDIHGTIFDVKHHCGNTSIPHGTQPIKKDHLWNVLWHEREVQPMANITIRAHTHRYTFTGDSKWLGICQPALQGIGSKYGARRCSGTVDFGVVKFNVDKTGAYTWQAKTKEIASQRQEAIRAA